MEQRHQGFDALIRAFQLRQRAIADGDDATVREVDRALQEHSQALERQMLRRWRAKWEADERQRRMYAEHLVTRQETGEDRAAWLGHLVKTAIRPRERRDSSGRSSARSGDSGSDGDGSSSSDRAQTSWALFVRDVLERITEDEIAREREGGWSA